MDATAPPTRPGILIQFEAPSGIELKLESLESKRAGIELRGVRRTESAVGTAYVETATVFVPEGTVEHFLNRFEQYASEETKTGVPKNRDLVDRLPPGSDT